MTPDDTNYGYHVTDIPKGTLGEASKVIEEALEFKDAIDQGCTVMALLELADLYGAMEAYVAKHNLTMDDLKRMADITARAFRKGDRT
jgi:hypothetical protein